MKKRVGIFVALGLVTVLSMSVLAGCGGKSSSSSATASTANDTKPDKISWYNSVGLTANQAYDKWTEEYEKKTGIKLENNRLNNNDYYQQLELAFASKNVPNVFNLAGADRLPLYASQGALADLTDLVKASGLITSENKAVWDSVTINGKIYGVPWQAGEGTITYVRKDWLDKLGLKVPTNYDEFINMLRAFKTLPECKNPFTAAKLYEDGAVGYLKNFYQDATPEFTKVNEKWVDGLQEENIKAALQRLKSAYAEGLIDSEVVTNTTSAARDKWYSGGAGGFSYWAGIWNVNLEDKLKANVASAQVVAIPAIKETKYPIRVPGVTCISSTSKNIPGIFKYFVQYMHDGGEGQVLFQNGAEGVHWKQDGDHATMLQDPENPKQLLNSAFISQFNSLTPLKDDTKKVLGDSRITTSLDILKKYGEQEIAQPVSKKLSKINSELTKLRAKTISSIVMGKTSINEGLENYKKEAKNLGVDEVLNEMNSSK